MTTTQASIEDVPLNSFHKLLTVRSGGGSLVDGYVLSIVGVCMVQMTAALQLSTFWQGMIAASALIGIFFGGFIGGWLTERLGRKLIFYVGPLLFLLCSLGQFWAESAVTVFIMRFLIGVAVGIEYPAATSLLVEFMPRKYRGPRLASLTVLWFAGAALAYAAGNYILIVGGDDSWRWVLASSAVISAALILVRLGTPESPRWLISKGRNTEAEAIVKQVYGRNFSLKNVPSQPEAKGLSVWSLLSSGYGKRMFFVSVFWTCSVIPVFAVYAFAPTVLQALNLKGDWASYGSVAITLLFVVGCMCASHLINAIGRRTTMIYSFLLSGLALLGLGIFHEASEILILLLFGAYALFIGGAQILQMVYPNEIFPTEIRTMAMGVGTSLSRVGAAVGTYLVPISLESLGIAQTMYAAAVVSLVGLIVAITMAPETRSLSLEEASALS